MKKESTALIVTIIISFVLTLFGFAVRYSVIDLSSRMRPHGFRLEGMVVGLLGFVLFAYASVRLANQSRK
ncbi:MAG: hypothetical protein KDA91_01915 [Planctomycetaceae bacterium]|nr:hypothetical protein [Planctomycetaceae bacterium]